MKHKGSFLLVYAVLLLFGLTGVSLCVFAEKDSRASLTENRMLAGFPELTKETVADGSFMSGVEDFLGDGMYERDAIVSLSDSVIASFSLETAEEVLSAANAAIEEEVAGADPEGTEDASEDTEGAAVPAAETGIPGPASRSDVEMDVTFSVTLTPEKTETELPVETEPAKKKADLNELKECEIYYKKTDGTWEVMYTFSQKNLKNAVELLNTLRSLLPEDGRVFFTQIPFTPAWWHVYNGDYPGWASEVEDTLSPCTDEGIYMLNTYDILEPHLLAQEKLYFSTDHHWTPLAASYVADELLAMQGYPQWHFADCTVNHFTGFVGSLGKKAGALTDEIDIFVPMLPTESYVLDGKGNETEMPFMYTNRNKYSAYLGGTFGPWRRFVTGADANRRCLIISDSYSNAIIPFLTPYYDEIFAMNLSTDYITVNNAGFSIGELVSRYGIDEILLFPTTASGLNSVKMTKVIWQYIRLNGGKA